MKSRSSGSDISNAAVEVLCCKFKIHRNIHRNFFSTTRNGSKNITGRGLDSSLVATDTAKATIFDYGPHVEIFLFMLLKRALPFLFTFSNICILKCVSK